MASVFNLTRNAVAVNLISGTDAGWRATRWRPNVAATMGNRMPHLVNETVNFVVDENTHNNLATAFQDLDNYRWLARDYIQDRSQHHPVWLHAKMNNETGERRSLVYDIGLRWLADEVDENGQWVCQGDALATATITRGPFWEDTTANNKTAGTGISCLAGTYDYSGVDVVGDAPARIAHLRFTSTIAKIFEYGWIGFRSANKHGTLANFVPLWECELGTTLIPDTTAQNDGLASPGGGGNTCMRTTFATSALWGDRFYVAANDVTANYSDQFGRFLVLLRARTDAGTTAEVRIRSGYQTATNTTRTGPIREIDPGYEIYEMGIFEFAGRNVQTIPLATYAASFEYDWRYYIEARRTGGAGNLYCDCLFMIPIDECFLYGENMGFGNNVYYCAIANGPKGEWQALTWHDTAGDAWIDSSQVSPYGLGVPIGDGRMYAVFGDVGKQNALTDTYNVILSIYPRWYNLRGTE